MRTILALTFAALAAVQSAEIVELRSDVKAWQLESKRWMKRYGDCRDNGRDYFHEALDAAVEKERVFQEARKP